MPSAILQSQRSSNGFRFCVRCGDELQQGRCPACSRRTRSRRLPLGIAIALVSALLVAALGVAGTASRQAQQLRHRVDRLEDALSDSQGAVEELEGHVDALGGDAASLDARVAALEAPADLPPDTAAVATAVLASVLTVELEEGGGSAFVSRAAGTTSFVVTNFHVVEEVWAAGGRGVRLRQGERLLTGSIVRVSPSADLALIEVPAAFPALRRALLEPKPGDAVMAVGSPLGLDGSVSTGVVSSVREENGVREIQFTAPVNPGNSGGPVVNSVGDLVGVTVSKFVGLGVEGLSFAIPIADVCAKLAEACG